jgi:hypothetical protein
MMVPVDVFERLLCNAKKSTRFPHRNASLHQPRCRRMAQRVRRFAQEPWRPALANSFAADCNLKLTMAEL